MPRREGYHWSRGAWEPSAAERRVLAELASGWTNAEIAVRLGISPETVKSHIARLLGETGCEDRVALAHWWRTRPERRPVLIPLFSLVARLTVGLAATALAATFLIARGPDVIRVVASVPIAVIAREDRAFEPQPEPLAGQMPAPTPSPTPLPSDATVQGQPASPPEVYRQMVDALNRADVEGALAWFADDSVLAMMPCVLGCRNVDGGTEFGFICRHDPVRDQCIGTTAIRTALAGQIAQGLQIRLLRLTPSDSATNLWEGAIEWSSAAMRAAGDPPFLSSLAFTARDGTLWTLRAGVPEVYLTAPAPATLAPAASPLPTEGHASVPDPTADRGSVDGRLARGVALGVGLGLLVLLGSAGFDLYRRVRGRRDQPI